LGGLVDVGGPQPEVVGAFVVSLATG
jgi:hypothetical protein